MLVASFLAGNVPLSFHLSEDRLKLISNFGVGLLVGTALVVIIPEGVETLYSVPHPAPAPPTGSAGGSLDHNRPIKRSLSGYSPAIPKIALAAENLLKKREMVTVNKADHPYLIQDQFQQASSEVSSFESNMLMTRQGDLAGAVLHHDFAKSSDLAQLNDMSLLDNAPLVKRQDQPDINAEGDAEDDDVEAPTGNTGLDPSNGASDDEDEEEEENDAHKYIGLALLSGFILMFLIDQMGPTHAHSHNNHVSVADFTELHNLQLDDSNIRMPSAAGGGMGAKKRGNPITIGLVVHAAADAFGLSTVLLQHGFSRRQTRQQVAIFSLAAPIGAILTYIFIQISGKSEASSLHWWTGMLLLFSGGTFLYVAMHVMSEMNNSERSSSSSGYNVGGAEGSKGLALGEVLSVIGGMIVPLILSVDHEH
ncbi:hypothetical protein CPC16_011039 [Podila verticillata]|nr:hypothetical protein CPC16_011039 [Podila verticillata]